MTANSYYNSGPQHYTSNSNPHRYSRREDAPLPPLPTSTSTGRPHAYVDTYHGNSDLSPVTSPFEDRRFEYPDYPRPVPTNQQPGVHEDPFADANAIPMHKMKVGAEAAESPVDEGERGFGGEESRGRRRRRRKAWYKGRVTWVVWILTFIQVVVFVVEIIRNASLTSSPIELHPQFNPMIGPSPYILINMGARYVPCMRSTPNITDSPVTVLFPCPNATTTLAQCSLSDLCGFSGVPNPVPGGRLDDPERQPNQWWRFIVPIFLHAGIVHLGFNMLLQVTLGRDMEKEIGSLRFALVYFSAGIFGFVFGGNFAPAGIASTGASGCLFGILALSLLDLLYKWKQRRSPGKDLMFIALDVVIAFVLGLLPGLDNFSHIGGFLMGLVLGICILHSPSALRERIGMDEPPYAAVALEQRAGSGDEGGGAGGMAGAGGEQTETGVKAFAKRPVGFFKGRKPLWWAWWLLRAGALVGVLVAFIVLLRNFYVYRTQCGWCKYLSCLPVNHWCDIGNLRFTDQSSTSPARRDLSGLDGGSTSWDSSYSPLYYTGYA